jgi:hypothetical protein
MRVLIVIALLLGLVFLILFVLTDLARGLSRLSNHSPPDPDGSDDWDVALDEFDHTAPPLVPYREQRPVHPYHIARTQGNNLPGSLNALDDLRSAL